MQGLFYREFLQFQCGLELPKVKLKKLFKDANQVWKDFPKDFRPLQCFQDYLKFIYYPFFQEISKSFSYYTT